MSCNERMSCKVVILQPLCRAVQKTMRMKQTQAKPCAKFEELRQTTGLYKKLIST